MNTQIEGSAQPVMCSAEVIKKPTIMKTDTEPQFNDTGTFLTDSNIKSLKRLFGDIQSYSYHVGNLWVIRGMLYKNVEPSGIMKGHPLFPYLETVNEIIGSLLGDNDVHFECNGRAYTIKNGVSEYVDNIPFDLTDI